MNNRLEIAKKFAKTIKSDDVEQIILFGSVARGDDNKDSDIDILIVTSNVESIKSKVHDEAINVILEKEEVISPHLMTSKHFKRTKDYPFLTNVLKEGVFLG